MGKVYGYQCESCDFSEGYRIGGGFFTENYFSESNKLTQKFRENIQNGTYGPLLQALALADKNGELAYDCEARLCQCNRCLALLVCRRKPVYRMRISLAGLREKIVL